jgi:uncharacterized protein YjbI with pentapeptide repeats
MAHNFRSDNLQGKTFGGQREQDLRKADFSRAKLQRADFTNANLCKADFSGAEIGGAIFEGAKLRGAKFNNALVDASLPGVNFKNAEIQGADFTDAELSRADFSEATAGLSRFGCFSIIIFSLILSIFSAFSAAIVTTFSTYFFRAYRQKPSFPSFLLIGLFAFGFTAIIRTILINSNRSDVSLFFVIIGTALILMVLGGAIIAIIVTDSEEDIGSILATTLPLLILLVINVVIILHKVEIGIDRNLAIYFPGLKILVPSLGETSQDKWFTAIFGALIGAPFGCRFAQAAIVGDKKFAWLWKMYIQFAARGGTLFIGTNLTDANFTSATLKGANFKKADIKRICWKGARSLEYALFGNCYLKYSKIRYLVVGEKLKGKNFDGLNLEGINLENSKLAYASFIETNLNQAKLCSADLTEANLKQAKLAGADLTNTCLTGACIEDWTIDETTILETVTCECIYLEKMPGTMNGRRREPPYPRIFEPGDFRRLYGKDNATVRFLIRKDYNQLALDVALKQVMRQNPDAFKEVKAVDDDVIVTIEVPPNTDKDQIEQEFQQIYQQVQQESQTTSSTEKPNDLPPFQFVLQLVKELKEMMPKPQKPRSKVTITGPNHGIINIESEVQNQIYNLNNYPSSSQTVAEIREFLEQVKSNNADSSDEKSIEIIDNGFENVRMHEPGKWQRWMGYFKVLFAGGVEVAKIVNPWVGVPIEVLKKAYEIQKEKHRNLPETQ